MAQHYYPPRHSTSKAQGGPSRQHQVSPATLPEPRTLLLSSDIYVFPSAPSNPPSPYSLDETESSSLLSGLESPNSPPVDVEEESFSPELGDEWDDLKLATTSPLSSLDRVGGAADMTRLAGREKKALEKWPMLREDGVARRIERIRGRDMALLRGGRRLSTHRYSVSSERRHARARFRRSRSWSCVDNDPRSAMVPHPRIHIPLMSFFATVLGAEDSTLNLLSGSIPQSLLFPTSGQLLLETPIEEDEDVDLDVPSSSVCLRDESREASSSLRKGCTVACDSSVNPSNPFAPPPISAILSFMGSFVSSGGGALKTAWNVLS